MIGGPEEVKLDHDWRCTRPPSVTVAERDPDGTGYAVTRCPMCGAEDREEQ